MLYVIDHNCYLAPTFLMLLKIFLKILARRSMNDVYFLSLVSDNIMKNEPKKI